MFSILSPLLSLSLSLRSAHSLPFANKSVLGAQSFAMRADFVADFVPDFVPNVVRLSADSRAENEFCEARATRIPMRARAAQCDDAVPPKNPGQTVNNSLLINRRGSCSKVAIFPPKL